MDYNDFISSIKRFGVSDEDICMNSLGISLNQICENVIISPGWDVEKIPSFGKMELLTSCGPLYGIKIWNIKNENTEMTYIKTGCGAPSVMDVLLCLGISKCKKIIFISSVGSLDKKINIGDIAILKYSISGDGASRYIASKKLNKDVFGEKVFPDLPLFEILKQETENVCNEHNIKWHIGNAFCTDTIVAQFPHIDDIKDMGCNLIDMETAVAFRAAKLIKKPLVALLCVSDNSVVNKSLINKRTKEEMNYRKFIKIEIIPKIVLKLIRTNTN